MFPKNILLGLTLNIIYIIAEGPLRSLAEPVYIGRLYECDHGLKGNVYAVNDRQLVITGFEYSGGPDPSFHGQLRGSKGIYTTDIDMYVTLPYPNDECNRLKRRTDSPNITLYLPRSLRDFETIGIFCYRFCHNFGHVLIPQDLNVPEAPSDLKEVSECSKEKNNNNCKLGRRDHNMLYPDCPGGNRNAVTGTTTMKSVTDTDISTTEVVRTTNGATNGNIEFMIVTMFLFIPILRIF